MIPNPDWDPLKTLNEIVDNLEDQSQLTLTISQELAKLGRQVKAQNTAIEHMAKYYNVLNQRVKNLEQR
jgi:hypothetical protein